MFPRRALLSLTQVKSCQRFSFNVRSFHASSVMNHKAGCNHDHGSSCNGENTVVSRCTNKISALLKPQKIKVTSSNDDPNGSHIQVEVISEEFTGKNIVQRQRLVYKAIWDELQGEVHAVDSIIAKTPKEAGL